MIEMLELVEDIPGIAFNTPDTEGNTPLHLAGQAGHVEVVTFLLNKVRTIQVDPINVLGFTPLMKAAIQGRVKCSKLLLISGNCGCSIDQTLCFTTKQILELRASYLSMWFYY
jgi:ankyrin repeat protein